MSTAAITFSAEGRQRSGAWMTGSGYRLTRRGNGTGASRADIEPLVGVVNAGSSSLKFSIYADEARILSGQIDGLGVRPSARAVGADGNAISAPDLGARPPATPGEALMALLPWGREKLQGRRLDVLGHRVVHGGMRHARPARVTPGLLSELALLEHLAPLHQPHNLAPIRVALTINRDLVQVACFDTAFHRSVPEVAQAFALPRELHEQGVRRYGFHGLSYEYIASALPQAAPEIAHGRVVVAHLGNGASLCAMRDRTSVATTMGFTALDGLPMGTRCGELDPGVIMYLIRERGMAAAEVDDLLYRRSGLLGLSQISSDFRDLIASADPRAKFAVDVFCYRVARHIGSLAAALGGLDGLVFTAGVGEKAAPVRAAICRACSWLGLDLDEKANAGNGPRISSPKSRVAAFVIATDENLMIARHARAVACEAD
jgi:acetate kinase